MTAFSRRKTITLALAAALLVSVPAIVAAADTELTIFDCVWSRSVMMHYRF